MENLWRKLKTTPDVKERLQLYKKIGKCITDKTSTNLKAVDIEVLEEDLKSESGEKQLAVLHLLGLLLSANNPGLLTDGQKNSLIPKIICLMEEGNLNLSRKVFWCLTQANSIKFDNEMISKVVACLDLTSENTKSVAYLYEALQFLQRLVSEHGDEMDGIIQVVSKLVFLHLCHPASKIREVTSVTFQQFLPTLMKFQAKMSPVLAKLFKSSLQKDMLHLFEQKQENYVLDIWCHIVNLLGTDLHSGASLLNALMEIVEKGFKSQSEDVLKMTFKSWSCLINNFSLNLNVLSNMKRLQLLLRPLKLNYQKFEGIAVNLCETFWLLTLNLRDKLSNHFEQICLPLLEQLLPTLKENSEISSASMVNNSDKEAGECHIALEILLSVLKQPENAAMSHPRETPTLTLSPLQTVIQVSVLLRQFKKLVKAAKIVIVVFGRKDNYSTHIDVLLNYLLLVIYQVPEDGSRDSIQSVTSFLNLMADIIAGQFCSPKLCLAHLDSFSKFPQRMLISHYYHLGSKGIMHDNLSISLMMLLLNPVILSECNLDLRFIEIFKRLCNACILGTLSPLTYAQTFLHLIDAEHVKSKCGAEELLNMWLAIATPLLASLQKTQEVNQGDSLENDFTCMHAVLLYPVANFMPPKLLHVRFKPALRVWTDLYKLFVRCSSLIISVEDNAVCEWFCLELRKIVRNHTKEFDISSISLEGSPTLPCKRKLDDHYFESICCLLQIVIECINFVFPSENGAKKEGDFGASWFLKQKQKPIGNLTSLVDFLEFLLHSINEIYSLDPEESDSKEQSKIKALKNSKFYNFLDLIKNFVSGLTNPNMIPPAIESLSTPLSRLMILSNRNKSLSSCGTKLENLWKSVTTAIQHNYKGTYDTEFLCILSPLLESTLLHHRRGINEKTKQFWLATFAPNQTLLTFPDSLKKALVNSKLLMPDVTASPAEEIAASATCGSLSELAPLVEPFAGVRSPSSSQQKKVTSASSEKLQKTPKSSRKSLPKVNVEDLPEEQFVVISASPSVSSSKKKGTRKSFVPAMYNELSQNSIMDTMSQSFSSSDLATKPLPESTDAAKSSMMMTATSTKVLNLDCSKRLEFEQSEAEQKTSIPETENEKLVSPTESDNEDELPLMQISDFADTSNCAVHSEVLLSSDEVIPSSISLNENLSISSRNNSVAPSADKSCEGESKHAPLSQIHEAKDLIEITTDGSVDACSSEFRAALQSEGVEMIDIKNTTRKRHSTNDVELYKSDFAKPAKRRVTIFTVSSSTDYKKADGGIADRISKGVTNDSFGPFSEANVPLEKPKACSQSDNVDNITNGSSEDNFEDINELTNCVATICDEVAKSNGSTSKTGETFALLEFEENEAISESVSEEQLKAKRVSKMRKCKKTRAAHLKKDTIQTETSQLSTPMATGENELLPQHEALPEPLAEIVTNTEDLVPRENNRDSSAQIKMLDNASEWEDCEIPDNDLTVRTVLPSRKSYCGKVTKKRESRSILPGSPVPALMLTRKKPIKRHSLAPEVSAKSLTRKSLPAVCTIQSSNKTIEVDKRCFNKRWSKLVVPENRAKSSMCDSPISKKNDRNEQKNNDSFLGMEHVVAESMQMICESQEKVSLTEQGSHNGSIEMDTEQPEIMKSWDNLNGQLRTESSRDVQSDSNPMPNTLTSDVSETAEMISKTSNDNVLSTVSPNLSLIETGVPPSHANAGSEGVKDIATPASAGNDTLNSVGEKNKEHETPSLPAEERTVVVTEHQPGNQKWSVKTISNVNSAHKVQHISRNNILFPMQKSLSSDERLNAPTIVKLCSPEPRKTNDPRSKTPEKEQHIQKNLISSEQRNPADDAGGNVNVSKEVTVNVDCKTEATPSIIICNSPIIDIDDIYDNNVEVVTLQNVEQEKLLDCESVDVELPSSIHSEVNESNQDVANNSETVKENNQSMNLDVALAKISLNCTESMTTIIDSPNSGADFASDTEMPSKAPVFSAEDATTSENCSISTPQEGPENSSQSVEIDAEFALLDDESNPDVKGARKRKKLTPIRSPVMSRLRFRKNAISKLPNPSNEKLIKKSKKKSDVHLGSGIHTEEKELVLGDGKSNNTSIGLEDKYSMVNAQEFPSPKGSTAAEMKQNSPHLYAMSLKCSPFSRSQKILQASQQQKMIQDDGGSSDVRMSSPSSFLTKFRSGNDTFSPQHAMKQLPLFGSPKASHRGFLFAKRLQYDSPTKGILKKLPSIAQGGSSQKRVHFGTPLFEERLIESIDTQAFSRKRKQSIPAAQASAEPLYDQSEPSGPITLCPALLSCNKPLTELAGDVLPPVRSSAVINLFSQHNIKTLSDLCKLETRQLLEKFHRIVSFETVFKLAFQWSQQRDCPVAHRFAIRIVNVPVPRSHDSNGSKTRSHLLTCTSADCEMCCSLRQEQGNCSSPSASPPNTDAEPIEVVNENNAVSESDECKENSSAGGKALSPKDLIDLILSMDDDNFLEVPPLKLIRLQNKFGLLLERKEKKRLASLALKESSVTVSGEHS